MCRWRVIKRKGEWRVMDGDAWHDRYPTLTEAHTAATQYAVADALFAPGGLTRLKAMQQIVAWRWDCEDG
jgi:hypothetical protein